MGIAATRIRPVIPMGPGGEPLPPCRACWKPMRPAATLIADYPDTVARANALLCSNCRKQGRKPAPPDDSTADAARALDRWLALRFERKLQAALLDVTIGTRNMYALAGPAND